MYTEDVPIYTDQSITQRREDNVYRRGTYIYQSFNYTEEESNVYRRGTYIYQSINYTEEVIHIYQSINYTGDKTVYT
jgi:hypothetical protein